MGQAWIGNDLTSAPPGINLAFLAAEPMGREPKLGAPQSISFDNDELYEKSWPDTPRHVHEARIYNVLKGADLFSRELLFKCRWQQCHQI